MVMLEGAWRVVNVYMKQVEDGYEVFRGDTYLIGKISDMPKDKESIESIVGGKLSSSNCTEIKEQVLYADRESIVQILEVNRIDLEDSGIEENINKIIKNFTYFGYDGYNFKISNSIVENYKETILEIESSLIDKSVDTHVVEGIKEFGIGYGLSVKKHKCLIKATLNKQGKYNININ